MKKRCELSRTLAAVGSTLFIIAAVSGCGVSKSGIGAGAGGSTGSGGAGHGGTVGTGGTTATGSTIAGSGGSGAGGTTKSGSGGTLGGSGGTLGGTGGTLGGTGGALKTGLGGTTGGGAGGSIVRTGGAGGGAGGTTKTGFGGTTGGGGAGGTTKPGFGGTLGGTGGTLGGTGGAVVDGGPPDVAPPKCTEVKTQAECDARTDCHSVFEDPGNCNCAALGCCARFKSCAAGDYANCLGPAMCEMVTPHCELPYVVAYTGLCYEGCVKQDDCGSLPCPQAAPKDGSSCSRAYGTCYYEDCAGAGRTLAKCNAGAWQVTSAACSPYPCEAPGSGADALTCAAGKLCVVTTDTSFRTTPACVDQTCGKGPMSTSCIEGLTGNCSVKYKLDGVVVTCAMPVP